MENRWFLLEFDIGGGALDREGGLLKLSAQRGGLIRERGWNREGA